MQRLIITCGGTGGHFYPGLAVAREFQAQGKSVKLLLSGVHAAAQRQIAGEYGIEAVALPEMPILRRRPLRALLGAWRGYLRAREEFRNFRPDALLAMGSYTGIPAVLAAKRAGIPLFLHDGNARLGRANLFFSRQAVKLGAGFPPVNGGSCRCPLEVTGMPVRPELRQWTSLSREEAIAGLNREFGTAFSPELPVILVTGGSLGAAVFNTVLPRVFAALTTPCQLLHLCGKGKLAETLQACKEVKQPHLVLESSGKMELFMQAADLVFSRSGGSTLAELALFGKAAVLVPYPFAADGHQLDNARVLTSAGAGILLENDRLTEENAGAIVRDFLDNPEKFRQMGRKAREAAAPEADRAVLQMMEKTLQEINNNNQKH